MKIKFVRGIAGRRGAMVITNIQGNDVCGQYNKNLYKNEEEIIVVKQRSRWFTLLIFVHELAHWATRKMFRGELQDKVNEWIDRYLKRGIDKK